MNLSCDKICPTAKLIALMRAIADIPYCRELAELMDAKRTADEIFGEKSLRIAAAMAPIMELRYHSISALVEKCGIKNILEIAAGFSPRGLAMTKRNPTIHYVESDLRMVLEEKKELVHQIMTLGQDKPENLCFCAADALDRWQLFEVAKNFSAGPIVIVTEGLLLYLSREEKEIMTSNIGHLLKKFGGVWITTDVSLKKRFGSLNEANDIKAGLEKIAQLTGRGFADNAFADETEANKFFAGLGFETKALNQISLVGENNLKSLKLNLSPDCRRVLSPLLQTAKVWVLESKKVK
ncbi:MAG: class I SAM-dependent methyltransferase [Candidatus Portnoybacteria bacterium]|nr:class I SAM-dependent methyltransferase [Candidatus Portnoybacteria bacterium]